jgi:hypothetical protein
MRQLAVFPMTYMVEIAVTGEMLFHRPSAAYPPLPDSFSAAFAQAAFARIPQQIREFSSCYAHDFSAHYQQWTRA